MSWQATASSKSSSAEPESEHAKIKLKCTTHLIKLQALPPERWNSWKNRALADSIHGVNCNMARSMHVLTAYWATHDCLSLVPAQRSETLSFRVDRILAPIAWQTCARSCDGLHMWDFRIVQDIKWQSKVESLDKDKRTHCQLRASKSRRSSSERHLFCRRWQPQTSCRERADTSCPWNGLPRVPKNDHVRTARGYCKSFVCLDQDTTDQAISHGGSGSRGFGHCRGSAMQCGAAGRRGEARARRQDDAGLSLLEGRGLDDNTTQA